MTEYKDNLLGEANSFLEMLEQVSRLAPLNKPVLIIGERGTGKELIANRLALPVRAVGRSVYFAQLRSAQRKLAGFRTVRP